MGERKYNKKIMAAVRALLAVCGFALGAGLAVLFFKYNPNIVTGNIRIVFVLSCGAVLSLTLLLSARPLVSLVLAISDAAKKYFSDKKPVQIAGFVSGIALGLMTAFVAYVVLDVLVPIPPLNIALTLLAAIIFCPLGAFLCPRLMRVRDAEEEETADGDFEGYVVTAAALSSDKAETVIGGWLTGKLTVLAFSAEKLADGEDESALKAIRTYRALSASGKLKTVHYGKDGDERERILRYARSRNYAVVTKDEEEGALYKEEVTALCLSSL